MCDRDICSRVFSDPSSFKEMTNLDMLDELKAGGGKAREAKQFMRRQDKQLIATGSFLITFVSERLPDRVLLCGISYRVRQLYPSVITCSKCVGLGHIRANCKLLVNICRKCGGMMEDGHICGNKVCSHCPGQAKHGPSDPDCSVLEYEKLVIRYNTANRVSYQMARKAIRNLVDQENRLIGQTSYAKQIHKQPTPNTLANQTHFSSELQKLRAEGEERERERENLLLSRSRELASRHLTGKSRKRH